MKKFIIAAGLGFTALIAANSANVTTPGSRVLVLAHNAYPDHGKYGDRLDRVIAAGRPFVVEEDLSWIDGKSLLIHGAKNAGGDDPTLESYFFPKVQPLMEKALRDGNKGDWPIVTVYLDIKNDPIEHLQAISKTLARHEDWITTAIKPADGAQQTSLDVRPMMVLVEDKQQDIKQEFFYDRIPVGGKVRVFGSVIKGGPTPDMNLSRTEAVDYMFTLSPEQVIAERANTYRRWIGLDWALIEKGGETRGSPWTKEYEARLRKFIEQGHKMGYFVSVYCLDGYSQAENQGWDKDYNVGSKEQVLPRWKAAIHARPDFISTDQYQDLSQMIDSEK
jgi:hypothetical protein